MLAFNHNILWLSSIRYSNLVYPGEHGGRGRGADHGDEAVRSLAEKTEKWLSRAALAVSFGAILYITVFSRAPVLIRLTQLVPFSSLKAAFLGDLRTGLQIAANVVLFVPFGYSLRRPLRAVFVSLVVSVGIELIQYHWILGLASVDDVLANALGGALGAGLYAAIGWLPRGRVISACITALMLSGALLGCGLWKPQVKEIYENEFTFQVEEATGEALTGYCFWFSRSPTKKRVQLLLKGEQTIFLPTECGLERPDVAASYGSGRDYTHSGFRAALPEGLIGSYEIFLLWGGYKKTPTVVYWVDGEVRHCLAEEGAQFGTLLADNAYCSVYQRGNSLYWVVKNMASEKVFIHIYTNQPELLPQKRQPSGFDNLDFRFETYEIEPIDGRRTACRKLPDGYPIAYIQTGMFDEDGVIWLERFRPLTPVFEPETGEMGQKAGFVGKDGLL